MRKIMKNQSPNYIRALLLFWKTISGAQRSGIAFAIMLMVFSSFFEVMSIGAVIPFLMALINPDEIQSLQIVHYIQSVTGPDRSLDLQTWLPMLFAAAAMIAMILRLILLSFSSKYIYRSGSDISTELFKRTIYQDYESHVAKNKSEIINTITVEMAVVVEYALAPLMTLLSSFIILTGFIIIMSLYSIQYTLILIFSLSIIYMAIIRAARRRLLSNSSIIRRESERLVNLTSEAISGIRDLIINNQEQAYVDSYSNIDKKLRNTQGKNQFINQAPRFIVEGIALVAVAVFGFILSNDQTAIISALPVLGALALAAQRALPLLQQSYAAWASLRGSAEQLEHVRELLEQPMPKSLNKTILKIPFRNSIKLKNLSFSYKNSSECVLKDVNIEINKGDVVGVIGKTGDGKSTFIDIIMGLLKPTSGSFELDGHQVDDLVRHHLRSKISHVPQQIFLNDSTILENIAFGEEPGRIDLDRVGLVTSIAMLSSMLERLPNGYQTEVGENGVRLSGGERQRIGIARALYRNREILILDEATSALDEVTEASVMEGIHRGASEQTIIIVAHRLSTLSKCSRIFLVANKTVREIPKSAILAENPIDI